jgi:hypothetical protein
MSTKLITIVIAVATFFYPRLRESALSVERSPLVMVQKVSSQLTGHAAHQAGKATIITLWKARKQPFTPLYN